MRHLNNVKIWSTVISQYSYFLQERETHFNYDISVQWLMLKLIGATDWERGIEYLIRIKQEGPSEGSSGSKILMLISKAVHEFVNSQ